MNVVTIFFIPGSCGNFLLRALSLCDNTLGMLPINMPIDEFMGLNVQQKYNLYTYQNANAFLDNDDTDWIEFEFSTLQPSLVYNNIYQIYNTLNGRNVHLMHMLHTYPYFTFHQHHDRLKGCSYKNILIVIDDLLDWVTINAHRKNSNITQNDVIAHNKLLLDNSIIKIKLYDLLNKDKFIDAICGLCSTIGIDKDIELLPNLDIISKLHSEWITTTTPL